MLNAMDKGHKVLLKARPSNYFYINCLLHHGHKHSLLSRLARADS